MIQGTNSEPGYSEDCSEANTFTHSEQVIPKTSVYLPTSSEITVAQVSHSLSLTTLPPARPKNTNIHVRNTEHICSKLPLGMSSSNEASSDSSKPPAPKTCTKKKTGPPPPLNWVPDDRYAFSEESIKLRKLPPSQETDHLWFHDVKVLKSGSEIPELKKRLESALCKPNYCKVPETLEPAAKLSEACKRAMRWQAQALAFSAEKPGYVIINRRDKARSHFVSRPDIIAQFVGDPTLEKKINERNLKRPDLTDEELAHLNKCVIAYYKNVYTDVSSNLKTIEAEVDTTSPTIQRPSYFYGYITWIIRAGLLPYSINSDLGRLRCGEATICALETKLQRNTTPTFIPVSCGIQFLKFNRKSLQGSDVIFVSDHTFLILMEPHQYRSALSHNLFGSFEYNLPTPVHIQPAKPLREINLTPTECRETSETETGNGHRSTPPEPISKLPLPELFENNYIVIADPWLQESHEVNSHNWTSYLSGMARRWGYKSFKKYHIKFEAVF